MQQANAYRAPVEPKLPEGQFYEVRQPYFVGLMGGKQVKATLDTSQLEHLTAVSHIKLMLLMQGNVRGNLVAYIIEEGLSDCFEFSDFPEPSYSNAASMGRIVHEMIMNGATMDRVVRTVEAAQQLPSLDQYFNWKP